MNISFLGQGLFPSGSATVGDHLMRLLDSEEFHSFVGLTAFSSEAGISGLSDFFMKARQRFQSMILITGVDQKGTSKEALEAILALEIPSYVFYQTSIPIFHPKIYLFEGTERVEFILGSSNLTVQGLFSNVEASLLVSLGPEDDRELVKDIKDYFKPLFSLTDPNLQPLTNELIEELVSEGIVPAEEERKRWHEKERNSEKDFPSLIDRLFPRRPVAKPPKIFGKKLRKVGSKQSEVVKKETDYRGELVWEKANLPASDVQRPASLGTNPTGGLRLTQAGFNRDEKLIDQTLYFRRVLFGGFKWKIASLEPLVETAIVPFEVVIQGRNIGKFNLEVRHKPSGEAGQGNYTTLISWGAVGEEVRNANLVGATLRLYAPSAEGKPFLITFG